MSVEIVMPKLSDTMEEGTILKWLKKVGDQVARGEVLAEVETDKADMELESAESGVLQEIKIAEGESAAVGAVIALVEEGGAASAKGKAPTAASGDGAAAKAGPAASKPAGGGEAASVKASPSARQLAAERGVDLTKVRGSGPDGRIVKEDVEAAEPEPAPAAKPAAPESVPAGKAAAPAPARAAKAAEPAPAPAAAPVERVSLSRMRQSIAKRMSEAFRDVPHFYLTTEIDMSEAVRLKDALKAGNVYPVPVTYTHLVLKATALALKRHPRINSSYQDGAIELKSDINLGMAVAVEDGLIVPVLRHVDQRSLPDIAQEARRLAELAPSGRFTSEDLSGGTFTVSNLGMLDITEFAAVINPPQAAILAVGAVKERPVVRDGAVVAGRSMRVTLSCDHRIIDGMVGGRFLEELKRLLEAPVVLVASA